MKKLALNSWKIEDERGHIVVNINTHAYTPLHGYLTYNFTFKTTRLNPEDIVKVICEGIKEHFFINPLDGIPQMFGHKSEQYKKLQEYKKSIYEFTDYSSMFNPEKLESLTNEIRNFITTNYDD